LNLEQLLREDKRLSGKLRIIETDHALKPLAVLFAHSGDSWFWFLGLIVLAVIGSPDWRYRAVVFTGSFIFLAFIVLGIKFSVRRQRPAGEWGKIYRATDPHSFPSGHAARAFLFAALAVGLGPTWLAVVMCIWAPLVALARVGTGVHYVSDVVVGMLVGIIAGVIVLNLLPVGQPLIQLALNIIQLYIRPLLGLA
jgi:membrane-associated phospholipid phosphatase